MFEVGDIVKATQKWVDNSVGVNSEDYDLIPEEDDYERRAYISSLIHYGIITSVGKQVIGEPWDNGKEYQVQILTPYWYEHDWGYGKDDEKRYWNFHKEELEFLEEKSIEDFM